jgi:hypothetical protein
MFCRFYKKWQKSGQTFLKRIILIKAFINRQNETGKYTYEFNFLEVKVLVKKPLLKDTVSGRISPSAAEFFS